MNSATHFQWRIVIPLAAVFALALGLLPSATAADGRSYDHDVVVYGGTAGGVTAAVQAARMGKSVALIEPTSRIGGMTTNGLSKTDFGSSRAVHGLAREFHARAHGFDGDPAEYRGTLNIVPSAALKTLKTMAAEAGVDVFRNERLDRGASGVKIEGNLIRSIRTLSGKTFNAAVFIDAGYEGDLMAAAGVSYVVGRESNDTYGEQYNGVQVGGPCWDNHNFHHAVRGYTKHISPYVIEGDPTSGLLPGIDPTGPGEKGQGDHRVQAYCYRLIITKADDRRPWTAPDGYDPSQYELLRRTILQNGITDLNVLLKIDRIGDGKYDVNNRGAVSTDFIGQNYEYPEADYAARERILAEHRRWQQGLLYFLAADPSMPEAIRKAMNSYGLTRDEFVASDGWPVQIYVREARRMKGRHVITDRDARGLVKVDDSVGLAAYNMDSHHVQRFVVDLCEPDAYVLNEGNVQAGFPRPYPLSYQALTPKKDEASNLLVTSAMSASHVAYGSIRLEPAYMILGQAGGAAAALAIDQGASVQEVDYAALRRRLIADGALLDWPTNVSSKAGESTSTPGGKKPVSLAGNE